MFLRFLKCIIALTWRPMPPAVQSFGIYSIIRYQLPEYAIYEKSIALVHMWQPAILHSSTQPTQRSWILSKKKILRFSEFLQECKLYRGWNYFKAKIILIPHFLYFGVIQNASKSKSAHGLNSEVSSEFLVAEKSKPCEIYKRICTKKHILVKKNFYE